VRLKRLMMHSVVRIITYVLLCGYSPFRSEDVKLLIKETTEAKIRMVLEERLSRLVLLL
jgi:hypothetical protein